MIIILYNKLRKYLSLLIYKNIYPFVSFFFLPLDIFSSGLDLIFSIFFQTYFLLQYYLQRRATIDTFGEANDERRKNYTIWREYTQDCTCLKSKINANMFINKFICRFEYINRFDYTLNFKGWFFFRSISI